MASTRRISLRRHFRISCLQEADNWNDLCRGAARLGVGGRTRSAGLPDRSRMSGWNVQWNNRAGGVAIDLDVLKRKSWRGITAHMVRITAPVAYDFKLSSSLNYVALHDLYRVDGETIVSGLPPSFAKDLR